MPKLWKTYKLEDAIEKLIDYRGKTPKKTTQGVPLVTAKVIKGGRILEPNEFISEEDYEPWMRRGIPEVGDVVLTTEAPLGEVAQIKDADIALAQRVITLRGRIGTLDSGYLKYFLQSNIGQSRLESRQSGTTVFGIKQSELRKVEIDCPPYPEQRAIASILSALDDKIENNLAMNRTLEDMAMALYKHWFVDFGPFQDGNFIDSEMGSIPEGWEVKSVYDLCEVVYGAPFKSKQFNEDRIGYPLIRIRDLKTNSPTFFTEEDHPKKTIIQAGDILAGMDAEFDPYVWLGDKAVLNQRVVYFKPKYEHIKRRFLFEAVKPWLKYFAGAKVGTTVIHLGKGDIDTFQFIYPTDHEILSGFNNEIEAIHEKNCNQWGRE